MKKQIYRYFSPRMCTVVGNAVGKQLFSIKIEHVLKIIDSEN
jgi:hypothetical protein